MENITEKLNVAVVGLGASRYLHCTQVKELKELYNLEAVWDIDKKKAEEFSKEFQCNEAEGIDEILEDKSIGLVVVATPCRAHKEVTIRVLQAGKHVLVEKPIAASVREADEMIAEANKSKKVLTVYHERRLYPCHKAIEKIIGGGELGEVMSIRTAISYSPKTIADRKRWPQKGSNVDFNSAFILSQTYDALVHNVDDVLSILGKPVKEVYCRSGSYEDLLVPTNWEIQIGFEDGPLVTIETVFTLLNCPKWEIFGTTGTLRMEYVNALGETLIRREKKDGTIHDEKIEAEDVSLGEPFREYYRRLYQSIVNGQELFVKPEEARDAIKVLWLALESSRKGAVIPWKG